MKTIYALSFVVVALIGTTFAARAAAQVVTGNIYEVLDNAGADVGSTVDYWYFHANSAGVVTIDTLSWEIDDLDRFDNDGNVFETVDVNSDGEIAFFDPVIWLFVDDGSLDVSDFIAVDDDSDFTYGDGSIYLYDSYLSPVLAEGDYVLAIGAFFLTQSEAVAGHNNDTYFPITSDGFDHLTNIDHGDYQITFTGDIRLVPEPSTLLLGLLAGLATLLCKRRR